MYLHSQLKNIEKSCDGRMAEWLMFGTANSFTLFCRFIHFSK